ncbi:uncharacterized protein LOC125076110 [Vanessa atalanta]|uniref:uncharacterized protein LOC125076110 n=1 Tax=Vanessa atalanta TaxID=42275 RepID=UPI001FCD99A7|nr:uncharacterized protein LOC125076110 [Vanessa atalanta]
MHCQRCQKSIRSCEGIKCGLCESRFHIKCINGNTKNLELECGDKGFHWICAMCQKPSCKIINDQIQPDTIFKAINALTEKLELVNKIQLPKLNNDLIQIKSVTDHIKKQNENILIKIDDLKNRKCAEQYKNSNNKYRNRNLNLSPRSNRCDEKTPILGTDKVRYRTRRRSYPIIKMLLQLNRRLSRGNRPKRKIN